jgi:hypothetical protein
MTEYSTKLILLFLMNIIFQKGSPAAISGVQAARCFVTGIRTPLAALRTSSLATGLAGS